MEFFVVVVVDSIQEPGPNLNTRDYTQMFSNMYLEKKSHDTDWKCSISFQLYMQKVNGNFFFFFMSFICRQFVVGKKWMNKSGERIKKMIFKSKHFRHSFFGSMMIHCIQFSVEQNSLEFSIWITIWIQYIVIISTILLVFTLKKKNFPIHPHVYIFRRRWKNLSQNIDKKPEYFFFFSFHRLVIKLNQSWNKICWAIVIMRWHVFLNQYHWMKYLQSHWSNRLPQSVIMSVSFHLKKFSENKIPTNYIYTLIYMELNWKVLN